MLWLGVMFSQEDTTMGTIEQIDIQSYTEYATAIYITDDGEEYEIVFTKHYDENIGYEEKTVVHVEKDGKMVDPDDLIWGEITAHLPSEKDCGLNPNSVSCDGREEKGGPDD
jgi:hypothetical protein